MEEIDGLLLKNNLPYALKYIDEILNKFNTKINVESNEETIESIRIIRDKLNRIEMHIEMKDRKKW